MRGKQPWKKLCVCVRVCVQSHVNDIGPSEEVGHDRGGHWVEAAISGGYHCQQEHATSMATVGSWGSAGRGHGGSGQQKKELPPQLSYPAPQHGGMEGEWSEEDF